MGACDSTRADAGFACDHWGVSEWVGGVPSGVSRGVQQRAASGDQQPKSGSRGSAAVPGAQPGDRAQRSGERVDRAARSRESPLIIMAYEEHIQAAKEIVA